MIWRLPDVVRCRLPTIEEGGNYFPSRREGIEGRGDPAGSANKESMYPLSLTLSLREREECFAGTDAICEHHLAVLREYQEASLRMMRDDSNGKNR